MYSLVNIEEEMKKTIKTIKSGTCKRKISQIKRRFQIQQHPIYNSLIAMEDNTLREIKILAVQNMFYQ